MTSRRVSLPPLRFTESGAPLCRWCSGSLPKRRRTWCSDRCVEEYRVRAWPGYARKRVYARDRGVCAVCMVDAAKERRRWRRVERRCGDPTLHLRERWPSYERTWWEADHIIAVAEGGGACGLENLQTLCYRCHRVKTRLQTIARRTNGTRPRDVARISQSKGSERLDLRTLDCSAR